MKEPPTAVDTSAVRDMIDRTATDAKAHVDHTPGVSVDTRQKMYSVVQAAQACQAALGSQDTQIKEIIKDYLTLRESYAVLSEKYGELANKDRFSGIVDFFAGFSSGVRWFLIGLVSGAGLTILTWIGVKIGILKWPWS
jgi:hypothetical protein